MTTLIPFRTSQVARYWDAVVAAVCGRAALSRLQEIELLEQTIALCDAQVDLALSYALPPEDAPIRAVVTKAVILMHSDVYAFDREGSFEEELHRICMWNVMARYAEQRLPALES